MRDLRHLILASALLVFLGGCSSVPVEPERERSTSTAPKKARPVPSIESTRKTNPPETVRKKQTGEPGTLSPGQRRALVDSARQLLGKGLRPFHVEGKRYNADCSGYVEAVYASNGLPFRDRLFGLPRTEGGAVALIHALIQSTGFLHRDTALVLPGDLIFWDNTYDRNRNGKVDDPLTHIGIVERVDSDGTVHYLHRGSRGVAIGYLNVGHTDRQRDEAGKSLNSWVRHRRSGDPPGTRYLASQLFVAFGRFDPALWATGEVSGK